VVSAGRLRLGMLLFAGCPAVKPDLSVSFLIHLCGPIGSVYARVLGKEERISSPKFFRNPERPSKTSGRLANLSPRAASREPVSVFFCAFHGPWERRFSFSQIPPKERRGFGKRKSEWSWELSVRFC
jgi:hypothetical protein